MYTVYSFVQQNTTQRVVAQLPELGYDIEWAQSVHFDVTVDNLADEAVRALRTAVRYDDGDGANLAHRRVLFVLPDSGFAAAVMVLAVECLYGIVPRIVVLGDDGAVTGVVDSVVIRRAVKRATR